MVIKQQADQNMFRCLDKKDSSANLPPLTASEASPCGEYSLSLEMIWLSVETLCFLLLKVDPWRKRPEKKKQI